MNGQPSQAVAVPELRRRLAAVMARVRHGEAVDVTEHGTVIARIVPVQQRIPAPVLSKLAEEGRLRRADRPGYRPRMHPGDGTDQLGDALAELRDEER